jgi:DNA-binding SARP family transcriptional activator
MVGELLKAGQYERVAELLREAQVASERTGDAILAHILDAARRICLACSQCRTEGEWHQRACEEADQREHELRQQLHTILDLISGHDPPETPEKREGPPSAPTTVMGLSERGPPGSVERLSLWQRIQALLGPSPRSPEQEAAVVSAETPPPPSLVVYCLGPFRVYQNDQLITDWESLKARSILKYLTAHRGAPIAKDILMDVFWSDADPEAARRNLHQAIYSLRQTLRRGHPEFQHIQFENDCYLLNPEMDIWLDCEEFEKHVQVGQRMEAAGRPAEAMAEYGIAEGLYQNDFLEEDLYEDWPRLHREHIRNMYLDSVDRLSGYYVQQGEYTPAIALCQKVLAQDNCHEEAHRRLMLCYLAQGQRHLAVRQYQFCVQALKEELDLAPSEETVALYRRITTTA